MDEVMELVAIVAGLVVLAQLADRFMRGEGPPGWPLGNLSREEFWRQALPWPRGVQEDAEIAWHVPVDRAPVEPARAPVDGQVVPPTRPQPRIVGR